MSRSVDGFKKWLETNGKELSSIDMGRHEPDRVYPLVSLGRLLERIETEDEPEVVARQFLETGGVVLFAEGKRLVIEVDAGTLSIPASMVGSGRSGS